MILGLQKVNTNGIFLDFIENSIFSTQINDKKIKKSNVWSFLAGQMGFLGHCKLKIFSISPKFSKMAQTGPKLSKNGQKKMKFAPDIDFY